MENWGLITYRETAMLYEEGVSARINKMRVASVVSHELGKIISYKMRIIQHYEHNALRIYVYEKKN